MIQGQHGYNALQETYIPDLMAYLPPHYAELREMQELHGTVGEEIGRSRQTVNELLDQQFIATATWGLDLWERELGIATDHSKSYERRREILLAKLRGVGTTTGEMVRRVAAAFSGGDVEVIEHPEEYRFEIRFIGVKGIPPNMPGLMQAIEQIKPAHLGAIYTFRYLIWDELDAINATWEMIDAKNLTWDEYETGGWLYA